MPMWQQELPQRSARPLLALAARPGRDAQPARWWRGLLGLAPWRRLAGRRGGGEPYVQPAQAIFV